MGKTRTGLLSTAAMALFVSSQAIAQSETARPGIAEKIEAVALEEIRATGIPSLQIAVGSGKDIVYEGAFGLADIENEVKATPESKYRTASVAKWFTAAAAMRLAEDSTLDLDEPVQSHCPQYPGKQRAMTSRQLLTHTSGIRHYIDYEEAMEAADTAQQINDLEMKRMQEALSSHTRYTDVISPLESFKDDALLFDPGTGWEYSSFGYRLLACVMQGAAGMNYRELMESAVFGPAGMNDTVPDDAWAIIPHRVTGYRVEVGSIRRADLRDVSENLPAGGYLSTASDLVRFAIAFDKGMLSEDTKRLMSAPIRAELDLDSAPSWRDAIPQEDKYGYGLMLFAKYSEGMVGHTGRQAGGSAIVALVPDSDTSIAAITNAKGWNGYLGFVMKIKKITDRHLRSAKDRSSQAHASASSAIVSARPLRDASGAASPPSPRIRHVESSSSRDR